MNKIDDVVENLGVAYSTYDRLANDASRYDADMRRYFEVAAQESRRMQDELVEYQGFMGGFYGLPSA